MLRMHVKRCSTFSSIVCRHFAPRHAPVVFVWPFLIHSGGMSRANRRVDFRYLEYYVTSQSCITNKGIGYLVDELIPNLCTVPTNLCRVPSACLAIVIATLSELSAFGVSCRALRPVTSTSPFYPLLRRATRTVLIIFSCLLSFLSRYSAPPYRVFLQSLSRLVLRSRHAKCLTRYNPGI